MDYIPKYFKPYELVPKATYELFKQRNEEYKIWWLFDPRTLLVSDRIRKRYGKMLANTWWHPGLVDAYGYHEFRGWRPFDCPIGAEFSQHKLGRANDLVPLQVTLEEIWHDIKDNGEDFGFITCIEMGSKVTWLHHDERNYKGLLIVHP